jgi:hypothetical protein
MADTREDFERWWNEYPPSRRVKRRLAQSFYAIARLSVSAEGLLDSLRSFPFAEDARFIPYPTVWLRQERWLDERAPLPPKATE